jgi:hypothetical protein
MLVHVHDRRAYRSELVLDRAEGVTATEAVQAEVPDGTAHLYRVSAVGVDAIEPATPAGWRRAQRASRAAIAAGS